MKSKSGQDRELSTPLSAPANWDFWLFYKGEKIDRVVLSRRTFFEARTDAAAEFGVDPDSPMLVCMGGPFSTRNARA